MYWHIDTDIMSLLVNIAVYTFCMRQARDARDMLQTRAFWMCLRVGIAVTVIDIAASAIMEPTSRVSPIVYHAFVLPYFITIELTIVAWFYYAITILFDRDSKAQRVVTRALFVSYLCYVALVLSTPWTGVVYSLGADGVYKRGSLFFLMVALYAVYTLALFAMMLIRRRHVPKGYSASILLNTPVIMAVSITVQLMMPGWLVIMPGYTFSLLMAFLFLQRKSDRENRSIMDFLSVAALSDQLTGLYNRAGMEKMVRVLAAENERQRCLVAVVDIDDLKSINDQMGHPEGDRAIIAVGEKLKKHFRATDVVARFGGDEFVVYLIGSITESTASQSLERLEREIGEIRVRDGRRVYISAGAALGIVGAESFESLCTRADKALYHVKQRGKHQYAIYDPSMEQTVFERPRLTTQAESSDT